MIGPVQRDDPLIACVEHEPRRLDGEGLHVVRPHAVGQRRGPDLDECAFLRHETSRFTILRPAQLRQTAASLVAAERDGVGHLPRATRLGHRDGGKTVERLET